MTGWGWVGCVCQSPTKCRPVACGVRRPGQAIAHLCTRQLSRPAHFGRSARGAVAWSLDANLFDSLHPRGRRFASCRGKCPERDMDPAWPGHTTRREGGNWQSGIVADGANNTADFTTAGLTGPMTINLDTPRTIGSLVFDNPTNTFGVQPRRRVVPQPLVQIHPTNRARRFRQVSRRRRKSPGRTGYTHIAQPPTPRSRDPEPPPRRLRSPSSGHRTASLLQLNS